MRAEIEAIFEKYKAVGGTSEGQLASDFKAFDLTDAEADEVAERIVGMMGGADRFLEQAARASGVSVDEMVAQFAQRLTLALLGEGPGPPPRVEYFLTIDAAKHIAMMSGTDRGFDVRDYFIECERRAKAPAVIDVRDPKTLANIAMELDARAKKARLLRAELAHQPG
jgi:hypothetical protein